MFLISNQFVLSNDQQKLVVEICPVDKSYFLIRVVSLKRHYNKRLASKQRDDFHLPTSTIQLYKSLRHVPKDEIFLLYGLNGRKLQPHQFGY